MPCLPLDVTGNGNPQPPIFFGGWGMVGANGIVTTVSSGASEIRVQGPLGPRLWGRRCSSSMWLGDHLLLDFLWVFVESWMLRDDHHPVYIEISDQSRLTCILYNIYIYIYTYIYTYTYTYICTYIYIYINLCNGYVWESRSQATRLSWNEQHHVLLYPICRWYRVRWLGIGKSWENGATIIFSNNRYRTCKDQENKGHDSTMNSWENHCDLATPNQRFGKAHILPNSSHHLAFYLLFVFFFFWGGFNDEKSFGVVPDDFTLTAPGRGDGLHRSVASPVLTVSGSAGAVAAVVRIWMVSMSATKDDDGCGNFSWQPVWLVVKQYAIYIYTYKQYNMIMVLVGCIWYIGSPC